MSNNSPFLPSMPTQLYAGNAKDRAGFSWKWLGSSHSLLVIGLAGCWFELFKLLSTDWDVDPQYNYGYLVPFLGASLLWRRWPDRPPTAPVQTPWLLLPIALLLLLQLPLALIGEANPEWRMVYWTAGFQVTALTGCFLYRWGGLKWLWHFGPAVLFMLVAIPWPSGWESLVIQGLMRLVAGLTIDTVGWLGIPAVQHGNLIQISVGVVGIDEACSGVRSLQSALMVSLFLGEMQRFSWWRRGLLLVSSLLLVLVANVGRTTTLVWLAAREGLPQMQVWHDTVGTAVMVIVLPSLVGLAWLMQSRSKPLEALVVDGTQSRLTTPLWLALALLGWLLAVQVATEEWYRQHEGLLIPSPRWSVAWPVASPHFKMNVIPENMLAMLRCSANEAAQWSDESGNQWSGFLLRWNPGKNSAQLAKGHSPDICIRATGAKLLEDFGRVTLTANGINLPFWHLSFQAGSKVIHVFHCLWSDRTAAHEAAILEDGSPASRLVAVMAGKRNLGQKVLEIVVQGPGSKAEAEALLQSQLPELIKPD